MTLLDKIFTRRRDVPRFSSLPRRTRRRLAEACDELTQAENAMASKLGLKTPPRLMLVDEEEAVILLQKDRGCTY